MNAGAPRGRQRRHRGRSDNACSQASAAAPGSPVAADSGPTTSVEPSLGTGPGEYKRSLIETALLITLSEAKGHGYALVERVEQLVGDQLYVDPGSIYRILRSLEEAGMIASSWETSAAGPLRRTYTLQPSGCRLLKAWADVLAERGQALVRLSNLAREQLTPPSAPATGGCREPV